MPTAVAPILWFTLASTVAFAPPGRTREHPGRLPWSRPVCRGTVRGSDGPVRHPTAGNRTRVSKRAARPGRAHGNLRADGPMRLRQPLLAFARVALGKLVLGRMYRQFQELDRT